jgi:RNA polymerase sigma-B factor
LGTSAGIANEERVLLEQLMLTLPERQRKIVWLRFFEDLSQSEIAEIVGTSQVHVSRLLREALRGLRAKAGPE